MGAERERVETFGQLENGLEQAGDWYHWGPYLSERQWGTVREDYSEGGTAWEYIPHDHARSRAYRWGEDGLAGFSDVEQLLCLALSLWNGRDPILKERIFGLTGNQGNHGEDAKEYWWYLDALPSHSWNRWRYHYPQGEFPYGDLVAENGRRGKLDPEYELLDTGAFDDDRYWIVEAHYAKAEPHDLLMTIAGHERRARGRTRSTCCRRRGTGTRGRGTTDADKPRAAGAAATARIVTEHPFLGPLELVSDGDAATVLFCENETNTRAALRQHPAPGLPEGRDQRPRRLGRRHGRPERRGHEGGVLAPGRRSQPGETATVRLRLRPIGVGSADPWADFDAVVAARRAEADEFYAELTPAEATDDEALVLRQAFAGMLWSKQLYDYDVARWLDGDPTQPTPPAGRLTAATRAGARSTPSTSCRCPTSGSTRGSRPGTSRSTASRSRTSTRRSRSTS